MHLEVKNLCAVNRHGTVLFRMPLDSKVSNYPFHPDPPGFFIYYHIIPRESRECVLGIVTRVRAGRSRNCSIPSRGKTSMSSPKRPDWLWNPLILMFNGYRMHVPGVQRPGREADHLPPFLRLK
jgi:hypothetical protein